MLLMILTLTILTATTVSASNETLTGSENIGISDNNGDLIQENEKLSASSSENEILRGDVDISVVGGQNDTYNVGDTIHLKLGTQQASYTPADIYIQVEGGGLTDNYVGTYTQATSSTGVPYTFNSSGTLNLRFVQRYYSTYFLSDYISFNVLEQTPSIIPGTYTDLKSLIDAADGELVLPYDFAYNASYDGSNFNNGILIDKNIAINGNGHSISGESICRIFDISRVNVVLNNVNLINGKSASGGAIRLSNSATLLINNSNIHDCIANQGGAIYFPSGQLTTENTNFSNNTANAGGAIYHSSGSSTLNINNCIFEGNNATSTNTNGDGGSISMSAGNLAVRDSVFKNNFAKSQGGAINIFNFVNNLVISDSEFIGNTANDGGAITMAAGNMDINKSIFKENTCESRGGAIYITTFINAFNVYGSDFENNLASDGGAIYVNVPYVTINLNNSNFTANSANNKGGAVYTNGRVKITDSSLVNNVANDAAYHIYQTNIGLLILENSRLIGTIPSLNVNDTYELGNDINITGTFNWGVNNNDLNMSYTINGIEDIINLENNQFIIELGNNLASGTHTISIKTFNDISANTYVVETVEKTFNIFDSNSILPGTYTDLKSLIDNATGELTLPYNFAYNASYDGERFKEGVLVDKNIVINGNGYTISGEGAYRIFDVWKANVVLNGVTLINGKSNYGGAIIVSNTITNLTINNSIIRDCVGSQGGAIHLMSGTLTIDNTSFMDNYANTGGAIYHNSGSSTLNINNCIFEGNNATSTGTAGGGGAILMNAGKLIVSDSTFTNNYARSQGGAINLFNFVNNLIVEGCQFISNSASDGGAIYASLPSCSITVDESEFLKNTAINQGGALYTQSAGIATELKNTIFRNNSAREGGALVNKLATLNINNNTFEENIASGNGGMLFASGKVNITDSSLINNMGNTGAYQIYQTSEGVVNIKNSRLVGTQPSLSVEDSYEYESDINVEGTFDWGVNNQALNMKYIIDSEEKAIGLIKNNANFIINIGSNLSPGRHTISIKTFTDESGNIHIVDGIDKTFNIFNQNAIIPGTYTDLKSLIDNSTGELTLHYDFVYNASYDGSNFSNGVLIDKNIVINGNGHSISGEGICRIFDISRVNVVLNNVNLINGKSASGGAIRLSNSATLLINNSNIHNCIANQGGAIYFPSGQLTTENTNFSNNTANAGGAIYHSSGSSTLNINHCIFEGNNATSTNTNGDGGAISMSAGNLFVNNSIFKNNFAKSQGGAINIFNFVNNLVISDSEFIGNTANDGGAITMAAGNMDINKSIFKDNTGESRGGAIYITTFINAFNVYGSDFENNLASDGGAIYVNVPYVTINLNNSNFTANSANNKGGAVYTNGKVKITNSSLINNIANDAAYHIYQTNMGLLILENSRLVGTIPSLNVNDTYELGNDINITGTFNWGVNNHDLNMSYTIDGIEDIINLENNQFIIKLDNNLAPGTHTISIKTFTDESGNTHIINDLEKAFLIKGMKTSSDIQNLIDNAEEGSVIELGNYAYENISNINITKNIIIKGSADTTISSSGNGDPIFILYPNGSSGFSIEDITFLVNNGDTIVKVMTENSDGEIIDNPEIHINNNIFTKANENVVAKSVTILELDSEKTNLKLKNDIDMAGNTFDEGIKLFQFEITGLFNGSNINIPPSEKLSTLIIAKTQSITTLDVKKGNYYQLTLKDSKGNVLANKYVNVVLNNIVYNLKTNDKGILKLKLKLNAGTYTLFAAFMGDDTYNSSVTTAKIKVNKEKIKLSVSKKVFKLKTKSKILKVTLKNSKGEKIKNKKFTLKIKGKTYNAKTNKNGVAKIKLKLNKRGTFKGTLNVPTDNIYAKLSSKIKIKIK